MGTKKICVLIPCFNEEKGIVQVIRNIPKKKLELLDYSLDIIVIDNNSTDNTYKLAKDAGARVIREEKQGKGHAIKKGFSSIPNSCDIVVMIDGDNTYDPKEIIRMIEPIESGFCEVVVGSRLHGKISTNSMSQFNRTGNWIFTFLVRVGYLGNVTDVCSGFFAWKKEVIDNLLPYLNSKGFSIEMEMITKMAKLGYNLYSVPISYNLREGKSSLNPLIDGSKIIQAWASNLLWKPRQGEENGEESDSISL